MKLADLTVSQLREVPNQELGNLHRRVHVLAASEPEDSLEQALEKSHDLIVAEWVRRGNEHKTPLTFTKSEQADTLSLRFVNDAAAMLPYICGPRILELGYGDGRMMGMLAEAGYEVAGIERKGCVKDVVGCETCEGDATKLPFHDGAYNTVVSMHLLGQCEDAKAALIESCRVAADVALHVVPLGRRTETDNEHSINWEALTKLADSVPYPTQLKRLGYGTALVAVWKRGSLPSWVRDFGVVPLVPGYVSVVGSQLKSAEPADCDICIREFMVNPSLELALRNRIKEQHREKLHYVYNPAGPHADSFVLYDLALVPRDLHRAFDDVEQTVKAAKSFSFMRRFQPPKPKETEYLAGDGIERLIDGFAEPVLKSGSAVVVEERFGGWRTVLQHSGKDALVFFEGDTKNRAQQFPQLVEELALIAPIALDAELAVLQKSGRQLPYSELAKIFRAGRSVADGASVVARVFDCLHSEGRDLVDEPWTVRRKALEAVFSKADFKVLKIGKAFVSKDKNALETEIDRVAAVGGSEGAMLKDAGASYPVKPEDSSSAGFDGWAGIKSVTKYVGEVLSVRDAVGGTWSYEIGVFNDKSDKRVSLGNTVNASLKANKGERLEMTAEEIIPEYDAVGKSWRASAVVQMVQGKTEARPTGLGDLFESAYKSGVLQANDEMLAEMQADDVVKGGKGSGNFGHAGRPGEAGGSGPGGGKAPYPKPSQQLVNRAIREAQTIGAIPLGLEDAAKVQVVQTKMITMREPGRTVSPELATALEKHPETVTPISIIRNERGRYTVAEGHSRLKYHRILGRDKIWALVVNPETESEKSEENKVDKVVKGGEGSGNFGHAGRFSETEKTETQKAAVGSGPEGRIDFTESMTGTAVVQEHRMGFESHEDAEQNKGSIGSAHTDVRMLPSGVATWEGFELFTPGRPGEHNKLLDYKSGEKIMMNFKIPHAEERPKDGELPVVRGPKSWMTIAARKPAVLNPGEPGATAHKWARIEQLDTFHWTAGTQDEHYKEFRLDFNKHEKLSGRWVMMYAPLRAGKFWLMTRPEEQRMDAERNEKGMEYRKLIDEVSGALGSGKSADDIEKGWT